VQVGKYVKNISIYWFKTSNKDLVVAEYFQKFPTMQCNTMSCCNATQISQPCSHLRRNRSCVPTHSTLVRWSRWLQILHTNLDRLGYQVFARGIERELLHRIQSVFLCLEKLIDIGHISICAQMPQRILKGFKISTLIIILLPSDWDSKL